MQIGMIGAGVVAVAIAEQCLRTGHTVVLSNRSGRTKAIDAIDRGDGSLALASVEEAAAQEVVLFAVPWGEIEAALSNVKPWNGRILIDATNPFAQVEPTLVLADLGDITASEIVAGLAPGARTVKAFNSMYTSRFVEGPGRQGAKRVLFVSGDDQDAKDLVKGLIESFGFAPVDLGDLRTGGRLQQAGGPLGGHDLLLAE